MQFGRGLKVVAVSAGLRRRIEELRRQLAERPNDVELLQKLGELLQKLHDDVGAAEMFFRVAEQFARDGFFLKAIALAKQVLKLNPDHPLANEALGEFHLQIQLRSEAVAYFRLAAAQYLIVADYEGEVRMRARLVALGVDPDRPGVAARRTPRVDFRGTTELAEAQFHAARKDFEAAIRVARDVALTINPRLVEANELLATWSVEVGSNEDAIVYWRSALRQHQAARDVDGIARAQAALAALGAVSGGRA